MQVHCKYIKERRKQMKKVINVFICLVILALTLTSCMLPTGPSSEASEMIDSSNIWLGTINDVDVIFCFKPNVQAQDVLKVEYDKNGVPYTETYKFQIDNGYLYTVLKSVSKTVIENDEQVEQQTDEDTLFTAGVYGVSITGNTATLINEANKETINLTNASRFYEE